MYRHLSWFNGVLIGTMLLFSGAAGTALGIMRATFYFNLSGLILIVILMRVQRMRPFEPIKASKPVQAVMLLPGVLNILVTATSSLIVPKLGLTLSLALTLVGQLCLSALITHFGWLGTPQKRFVKRKALGLLVMGLGLALMVCI